MLPKPAHRIPFWIGGSGPRAEQRAIDHGDGFHFIGLKPDEIAGRSAACANAGPSRSS